MNIEFPFYINILLLNIIFVAPCILLSIPAWRKIKSKKIIWYPWDYGIAIYGINVWQILVDLKGKGFLLEYPDFGLYVVMAASVAAPYLRLLFPGKDNKTSKWSSFLFLILPIITAFICVQVVSISQSQKNPLTKKILGSTTRLRGIGELNALDVESKKEIAPIFIKALNDNRQLVRRNAAMALRVLADIPEVVDDALPVLIERRKKEVGRKRRELSVTLAVMGYETDKTISDIIHGLREYKKQGNRHINTFTDFAIYDLRDIARSYQATEKAVPILIEGLEEESQDIQRLCAYMLKQIGTPETEGGE